MDYWEFKEQYFVAYVLNQDMLSGEPEQFSLLVRGTLFARNDPDTPLGAIEGEVLLVRDWPGRAIDLFDGIDGDTLELYEDYYMPYIEDEEELVLLDLNGEPIKHDIDVLHGDGICYIRMQGLKESCWGEDIGLFMMYDFIQRFAYNGSCDTVLIHPSSQIFDETSLDSVPDGAMTVEGVSAQPLRQHYARLGFREIKGTEGLMFLDLTFKYRGIDAEPSYLSTD